MTRRTRILAVVGAVLALLLVLLLVLPFLFRDRIAERVKVAVNRNVEARVDWSHVGLSLFRDFPNLTLTLDDLTAVGVDRFEDDTLAIVPHLRVSLGLGSVLRSLTGGTVVVRAIELEEPQLGLIKLADGTANWDIAKKTPEAEQAPDASKPMDVSLKRFEIHDADIAFDNRQAGLQATVVGYDQSLSGDFSREVVDVRTKADADTVSVTFAGVPYLSQVRLALTADARADLGQKVYTLERTELRLNDLLLGVSGSAATVGENMRLDLAFEAPSTDFRSILSLVPAVYAHDFDQVKTSGSFTVDGRVQGEYGDAAFPSFAVNAKVNDAAFQYPDLPLPARSIFLDLALTNPGGSADSTVVTLDRFRVQLGRNPVEARMVLRTPVSDPDVDARVKGTVDLADIRRTVKLEKIEQLAGIISADAAVRTRKSWVDRKQYDRVAASGTVNVGNLTVRGEALPQPLAIEQASLRLAPEHARLESFRGTVGSSDIQATGTLENMLAYAFRDDTLRGSVTLRSNRFNLDEWRSKDTEREVIPVPPRLDLALDLTMAELTFDKLQMRDTRGRVHVKDQRATLDDFRMNTLGGQIGVTGFYETKNLAAPTFDVGFRMTKVDIPSAFQAFTTIQALAPVAKYASGNVTVALRLAGALGQDLMPLFPSLTGNGTLQTSNVALRDFPAMERIVEATKLDLLNNPTMRALKATFRIQDGRLVMQPFDVKLGGTTLTVAGSNGFDQSLQYTLGLRVPRSVLGSGANQAITGLLARAGRAGVDLGGAAEIPLSIQLGGTVTSPSVKVDVDSLASSVTAGAQQAVTAAVTQRASAEALKLIEVAERQASEIRGKAQSLAEKLKSEGYQQADSLMARAGSNPLRQTAASLAAGQLRKQSDEKAATIIEEAGARADSVVAAARRRAEELGGAPAREGQVAAERQDTVAPPP
ncbi:MAG TPA: AsmA-like C-terminal region-containing protein [Gemmatimonadales bacterium]|nr:AsmA-like C-terminal region-containing protein [Gemmatimonadales bacterium]